MGFNSTGYQELFLKPVGDNHGSHEIETLYIYSNQEEPPGQQGKEVITRTEMMVRYQRE